MQMFRLRQRVLNPCTEVVKLTDMRRSTYPLHLGGIKMPTIPHQAAPFQNN